MDSWFLAAVKGSAGSEKQVASDPMRQFCLGRLKNVPVQLACVLTVAVQAFLLNYHLVMTLENQLQWLWFIGDVFVVLAIGASFYLKEWRLPHVAVNHKDDNEFSKGLPYASVGWLFYALLLSIRVCLIFTWDIHDDEEIGDLKLIICGTAIVCIFFTWGHHHNHESLARRASIISLVKLFTIDLLDTVDLLDVLFITQTENPETFPSSLEYIILVIVSLNLIRPAIVLVTLFVDHFGSHIRSLKIKIIKALFELLLLNVPLLVIRIYIAANYEDSISVFLVKNSVSILFGIVEIYDCSYDVYTTERETVDSRELSDMGDGNGAGHTDHGQESLMLNSETNQGEEAETNNTELAA